MRLVAESLRDPADSGDLLPLRVAFNFSLFLSREVFLEAIRARRAALAAARPRWDERIRTLRERRTSPPQVAGEHALEARIVDAQLAWIDEIVAQVEDGGLAFVGDPDPGWAPAPDDPGWRMFAERQRYMERLAAKA